MLKTIFDGDILEYYQDPMFSGHQGNFLSQVDGLDRDLERYLRQLKSIRERLPLWNTQTETTIEVDSKNTQRYSSEGPIFVVHGRDEGRKNEVARVLERSAGREVVILHEQANMGRTVLEKFEQHAVQASFAVVILTADDEGKMKGDAQLRLRGRQNVIFELGYFFAALGRDHVMVLMDSEVDQPSDVHGLVYQAFDSGGAWKQKLATELEATGIRVDRGRIPQ